MRVESKIQVHEINGEKKFPIANELLTVKSHWNFTDRIILQIGSIEYTVLAKDLYKAITNASNH